MKRVTLTNKTHYLINEGQQQALLTAIDKGAKYVVLKGDVLMTAAIIGIQDEEIFEEIEHRKNLDYKCVHGKWHGRDDRCYGHDAPLPQVGSDKRLKADNRSDEEQYAAARAKAEEVRQTLSKKLGVRQ